MNLPWIKKATTAQADVLLTLTCFVVTACTVKFVLDGLSITALGKTFEFGHTDAMAYAALLGPVLGAHGYTQVRKQKRYKDFEYDGSNDSHARPDDPDAGN